MSVVSAKGFVVEQGDGYVYPDFLEVVDRRVTAMRYEAGNLIEIKGNLVRVPQVDLRAGLVQGSVL